jgi:hypothetical protein
LLACSICALTIASALASLPLATNFKQQRQKNYQSATKTEYKSLHLLDELGDSP